MKSYLWKGAALGSLMLAAGSASAIIIIAPGPGNFWGDENVVFNSELLIGTGPLVQGITNNSNAIVDFWDAGEDLDTPSGGQARIDAVDGAFSTMSMALNNPAATFRTLIWNLNAVEDGSVTFTVHRTGGADFVRTFSIDGPGQNFFRIQALGEQITGVSFTSTADLDDVKQVRVGGVVPEPATIALLGLGAVGLMRRRKR